MMREKVVTIVIGLVVGAMLAAAYFFGPQLVSKGTPTPTPTPAATSAPTTTPTPKKLTITSPQDNISTTDDEIKIVGVATPNAKIIIFSNADQKQVTANSSGKFEATVELEEGENEIAIAESTNPSNFVTRNVTLEISE